MTKVKDHPTEGGATVEGSTHTSGTGGETAPRGAFELAVTEAGKAEQQRRIEAAAFSIGSHPSNDLQLRDPAVSRFHCEVRCDGDAVLIRDLDSRNGTFIDGVRVKEGFLRTGAAVQIGRVAVRFGSTQAKDARVLSENEAFGALVGRSPAMRAAFAVLERAAGTNATVLLEGETGTGKGEAALELHRAGARRGKPFVVVDCGSIPENLFEAELFGNEKGAFTGADALRVGAFETAQGGTVFLDEVGELPLDVQPKLLRALEERQIRRLGQSQMRPVDVRVVAATNRDLRTAVNDGSFRADLYYRLAVVRARLPALRERFDDLTMVAARLAESLGADAAQLERIRAPHFVAALRRHAWRGNVRELRNYVERCLVLDHEPLPHEEEESWTPPVEERQGKFQEARARAMASFEQQYFERLLRDHEGKVAAAADAAGLSRVYLYRLLGKYGLLR